MLFFLVLLSDLKFYFVHLFSIFMSYILFGSLFLVRGVILYFASLLVLSMHACLFLGIYLSSIESVYNRIYVMHAFYFRISCIFLC